MRIRRSTLGPLATACALLAACEADPVAAPAASTALTAHGPKALDPAVCSLDAGGFTLASSNPWFPLAVGDQWGLEGEEDGEPVALTITVLDRVRTIGGVNARVVEEREWEDDELLEVSWNYFVEAGDGTVCYLGEDVDIFEEGGIVHDGAWCADEPGNAPGIAMPADPRPGMTFPLEIAPGVAEDAAKIVGTGPVEVPAGRFEETIRFRETTLDGDKDYKVWASGTGIVVDGPLELVTFAHGQAPPAGPIPTEQACGS